MKYFGKRYLYKFLQEQGFNPPTLKKMNYKKYRDEEILKDFEIYLRCVRGKRIFVTTSVYNEDTDEWDDTDRYAFSLKEKKWEKIYQRTKCVHFSLDIGYFQQEVKLFNEEVID